VRNPGCRLFCFHYAGGRAEIYNPWPERLPETIEVCAVQLPGRSYRLSEAPIQSVPLLVEELRRAILPLLDRPFAFFGHSMGALTAFELARVLVEGGEDRYRPTHLIVSGKRAPQIPSYYPPISELPDLELLEVLRALNGTPDAALQEMAVMKLFLPAIRADFALDDRWSYRIGPPLPVPIIALSGTLDKGASPALMAPWREQTTEDFRQHKFQGEHFFIHQFTNEIVALVADVLGFTQHTTTEQM
jgi:medium-chain acyl-[acyl-carrier-protein] hydrolase